MQPLVFHALAAGLLVTPHFGLVSAATSTSTTTTSASSLQLATSTAFDASASTNLAAYWGHSTGTSRDSSLSQVCNATGISIAIIGFVREFAAELNALPTIDLAPDCEYDISADSTISCPDLAQEIEDCQALGRKVFLSIGGSSSNTTFENEADAEQAAHTLWNLFGGGTDATSSRPFGNVTIDGFDIDHESADTDYYNTFASTLKTLSSSATTKCYLSAAPLCANTTVVYPADFYTSLDFVWTQFYNAQSCAVGTTGFNSSVNAWRDYLDWATSSATYPKLYLGGLAFENNKSGYVVPSTFVSYVDDMRDIGANRFGGVMLWDGTKGLETLEDGLNFINITETALQSRASSTKRKGFEFVGLWVFLATIWYWV